MTKTMSAPDLSSSADFLLPLFCPDEHDHATEHEHHCSHCRAIVSLLPKLKQPGWHEEAHSGLFLPPSPKDGISLACDKKAAKKKAKAEHKKYVRLKRELRGEHTRVRKKNLKLAA